MYQGIPAPNVKMDLFADIITVKAIMKNMIVVADMNVVLYILVLREMETVMAMTANSDWCVEQIIVKETHLKKETIVVKKNAICSRLVA